MFSKGLLLGLSDLEEDIRRINVLFLYIDLQNIQVLVMNKKSKK